MIRKKDFIDAIGEPDALFEEAVSSALSVVRSMELTDKHAKDHRFRMIFPIAAAAALLIAFIGLAIGGPIGEKPDPIKAPDVFTQPNDKITPEPASTDPQDEPSPESTIDTELPATPEPTPDISFSATEPVNMNTPEATPAVQATLEAEQPYESLANEEFDVNIGNMLFDGNDAFSQNTVYNEKNETYESIDVLKPGCYDLFEETFGQGLENILDDGYSYEESWLTDDGITCWLVGNGVEQYVICRLFEEEDGVTFSLSLPYSDTSKISGFMDHAPEWLAILYYKEAEIYLAEALGIQKATLDVYTLNTLSVKVNQSGEPAMVGMSFGINGEVTLCWERQDSGEFEFESGYVEGIPAFGYDDSSYDADTAAATGEAYDGSKLFMLTFNQEIVDLYPGYEISCIENENERTAVYFLNDGLSDPIMTCRISNAASTDRESYVEGKDSAAIRLYMPDNVEIVDKFMAGVPEWLAKLYYAEAPAVLERDDKLYNSDYSLAELMMLTSLDGRPYLCKMTFGNAGQSYICWGIDDNGDFRVINFTDEIGPA